MPLSKTYEPAVTENKWYEYWEKHKLFHASVHPDRTPYSIVIPPPNITGVLHMGHILNNTLQDVFIRYRRMMGFEACWIPGTDHAGIATQNVVEKSLMKEGKTRHDIGREDFIARVWEWRQKFGGVITKQLRTLGVSCDWERERFTMEEALSGAVREAFVSLYEQGLIYKGKYIVNWCPKDHTAISDDEVNYAEQQGKLYYIKYPVDDETEGEGYVGYATAATTRPETMLGDTALAVHPDDARYARLVGLTATLPLTGRQIPIVADSSVDPAFGTGIVKVTPAHDPNDYWIGQRHDLQAINILDVSGSLNEQVPEAYRGLDRFEARKRIVHDLDAQGLLLKVEDHTHSVGRCYRCDTVIEPYLSDQWFVRMKPLAEPALKVVLDGTIRFYPDRWARVYEHWMSNIRDWCISRQLWWGHRIPVWYCIGDDHCLMECREPIVSRTNPERCPHCGSRNLRQDEDVLDTWFSSWLWPFSVHDWPAHDTAGKGNDLRYFYPTNTLVTAPDIIFFWVARMIMAGLRFGPTFTGSTAPRDNVPFRDVYFTSIIRDDRGRKMSKSLGNSPEPLDLIAEFGADAVRFTILYLSPLGQDVYYSREKNELGRNFANKIWNAARFLLMNREQIGAAHSPAQTEQHLDLADRWILSRFHSTADQILRSLDQYEVTRISKSIYDFLWHDFCDWYLEMIKSRLYGDEPVEVRQSVLARALSVFDGSLRLLHPLMPFITEELWQNISARSDGETIMRAPMVAPDVSLIDTRVESEMGFVQQLIEALRNIRGEMGIPPSVEISVAVRTHDPAKKDSVMNYEGYLRRLARVAEVSFIDDTPAPRHSASAVVDGDEVFVPLEGLIDLDVERERLEKEIDRIGGMLKGIHGKLQNKSFMEKAPEEVVRKEQEKLGHFTRTMEKLKKNYEALR
jgi:valyl-tRNA synthetase